MKMLSGSSESKFTPHWPSTSKARMLIIDRGSATYICPSMVYAQSATGFLLHVNSPLTKRYTMVSKYGTTMMKFATNTMRHAATARNR